MAFLSSTRLPHVLPPSSYWAEEHYQRERQELHLSGWHLVGCAEDLARPGDFLTCELLGHPIQIRNFDGQLRALSNVCAHRHCLLTHRAQGHSSRMRCQYHGWEYALDGSPRRIPAPKNFVPYEGAREGLPNYRVETCGQLVFVSPQTDGPDLQEYLGDFFAVAEEHFGNRWRRSMTWRPSYPVNWKIPIENSLEAYHVPCVHPNTFREDPGEQRSTHRLERRRTAFQTTFPFSPHSRLDAWYQRVEGTVVRTLGVGPTGTYQQHHVFPNLLFSFTDAISLCHCVIPTGARSSQAVVCQFGRSEHWRGVRRGIASLWGKVAAAVTKRILVEDMALYPDIQRGLERSPHRGVLGRCEERIHAFQAYVQTAVDDEDQAAGARSPALKGEGQ